MTGRAYNSASGNTDEKSVIEADFDMKDLEYDRIERLDVSGIKVCMEFPKQSQIDGDEILREVKDILSGALRESLDRASI